MTGLLLLASAACSAKSPLEGMQPGERGRVVRVIDGDALVLDTGQSVRLVGIEAPARNGRYDDPDPYAEKSARMLEDLVMGREVRLYYPGLTRDRYDRALAHITTADNSGPDYWINLELVRRGAVRVRLYPDTDRGGATLLEAEEVARSSVRGLWHESAYRPVPAEALDASHRGFTIVSARLGEAAEAPQRDEDRRRSILCSRQVEGSDLIIDMTFNARPACDAPAGKPYLLRGWVSGERMELDHPLHLQDLDTR
ncbi:thermonuclease family protein [Henriciella sp.]|uniref:thermonuclease family protein n=1 Tax=Henriciella sp. TaxID=1968823 RepID=UPI00262D117E|nr:thermonuclease family protein [Henriciella sp.]